MMKSHVSSVSALAVLLASAGCASSAAPEPVGSAEQAVIGGGTDTTNQFPWVGYLTLPNGQGCSAELITPDWLLTANHCVTGTTGAPALGNLTGNYEVSFDPLATSGTTGNPSLLFTSSTSTLGVRVFPRKSTPIDSSLREDNAQDLALIRLDRSVPPGLIPLAPVAGFSAPAGALGCTSIALNGVATLVGYGPTDGSFCSNGVFCSSGPFPGRNSHQDGGWGYQTANSGDQYLTNTWSTLSYHGIGHGDSGGALFWGLEGEVCGVNSGLAQNGAYASDYDAQVDSPLNKAFLAANLLNADGSMKGTCNLTTQGSLGEGNEAGGTVVQISGNGFDTENPPTVFFGGVASRNVTCSSTTQCSVTAPPGVSGRVPVTVTMWTNAVCTGSTLTFQYGPVPPSCTAQYQCQSDYTGSTVVSCPFGTAGLSLYNVSSGNPVLVDANTTQDLNAFVDYYSPAPGTQITYEVVATDADGSTPGAPMMVTATDCSCHPATVCGGGYNCGTLPDGCGGTLRCGTCSGGLTCSNNTCSTCTGVHPYCGCTGTCATPLLCERACGGL